MNSLARLARWLCSSIALGILLGLPSAALAQGLDVAGSVGFELRGFPYESISGLPSEAELSAVIRPELEWRWDDGDQQLRFLPFFRIDQADDQRTHFDIRELYCLNKARLEE